MDNHKLEDKKEEKSPGFFIKCLDKLHFVS
jgi:hypothetical protein